MAKIIMTRGIPGSGKSTWAKAWVQDDVNRRVRINRDDMRRMLYGGEELKLSWKQESTVSALEKAMAIAALDQGKDVVIDATNLRAKFVRPWLNMGYPVEFKDFNVRLEVALARNVERGSTVPASVIERMYRESTRDGLLLPPLKREHVEVKRYEPDPTLPQAYIFDIDGTLAHMNGRSPFDWKRVGEDLVDGNVLALLRDLRAAGNRIIFMSGRDSVCREETEAWLDRYVGWDSYDILLMRAEGDNRKDAIVKYELFNDHVYGSYNVLGVVDDRNQVVKMWRDMGLKVYQCAEGNF